MLVKCQIIAQVRHRQEEKASIYVTILNETDGPCGYRNTSRWQKQQRRRLSPHELVRRHRGETTVTHEVRRRLKGNSK